MNESLDRLFELLRSEATAAHSFVVVAFPELKGGKWEFSIDTFEGSKPCLLFSKEGAQPVTIQIEGSDYTAIRGEAVSKAHKKVSDALLDLLELIHAA